MADKPQENTVQQDTDLFMSVLHERRYRRSLENLSAQISGPVETDSIIREAVQAVFQKAHDENESLHDRGFNTVLRRVSLMLVEMGHRAPGATKAEAILAQREATSHEKNGGRS